MLVVLLGVQSCAVLQTIIASRVTTAGGGGGDCGGGTGTVYGRRVGL